MFLRWSSGVGDECGRPESTLYKPATSGASVNGHEQPPRLNAFPTTLPPAGPPVFASHSSLRVADDEREVTDAATILEFIAWGKRKEVNYASHLSPAAGAKTERNGSSDCGLSRGGEQVLRVLQLTLPAKQKVIELVEYHIECLLWHHAAFHGPNLRQELATFYSIHNGDLTAPGLDLQWAALLFAVLAGSMVCSNVVQRWGFRLAEQELLAREWLQGVTTCLHAGQYMSVPSMLSCSAIVTMTMSAHLLGSSNPQAVLLASAVRIAQSLGLHRLDETASVSLEREVGRRVWAQLCCQDWFSIPFTECYSINPLYSQTLEPLHCDEITLEELPVDVPTITSYTRYLHKIAALMPELQDGIVTANTPFTKYEQILQTDRKMRDLTTYHRPSILRNTVVNHAWPRWTTWARRSAAITSSHKIIMIHRKFLSASFTNPAFAFTRQTCVAASKTILNEVALLQSEDTPILWIYHAFAVAAAITLSLDLLHRERSDSTRAEHRQLVEGAATYLEGAQLSTISSRGIKVIKDLLLLESSKGSARATNKRKAGADAHAGPPAKKPHSIDMGVVVRDFQRTHSLSQPANDLAPSPAVLLQVQTVPIGMENWRPQYQYQDKVTRAQLPDLNDDFFASMEEMMPGFRSGMWMNNTDAFGDLLHLAQS